MPKVPNSNARILLYADDTSVILSNPSLRDFELNMNKALVDIHEWFKTNMLSLNLKKTHYLQFRTKNSMESNVSMEGNIRMYCGNKQITNM